MNKRKIERECSKHNNRLRNVKHKSIFKADEFLNTINGNILITGGTQNIRNEFIKKFIFKAKQTSNQSIIVLSNNNKLQKGLISLAETGSIGRLFISSDEFKKYDVFFNMNSNLIADYFSFVALLKGYRDTSEIHDYIGAFLNILQTQAPVTLSSMLAFSKNTDSMIKEIALSNGYVGEQEILMSSGKGGTDFRRLLNMVYNAFCNLTTKECSTKFNIITAINTNCVTYINTDSPNYELLSLYFMLELKQVMNKRFTVIFDDSSLLSNSELLKFIELLKQKSNVNTLVSAANIMSLPSEDKLKNFNKKVIYLNGEMPPNDTQLVLDDLGSYSHFDVTSSQGTPPNLFFSFLKSENNGITEYSRSKILVEEEVGNDAVLQGHNGPEIAVARRFVI